MKLFTACVELNQGAGKVTSSYYDPKRDSVPLNEWVYGGDGEWFYHSEDESTCKQVLTSKVNSVINTFKKSLEVISG